MLRLIAKWYAKARNPFNQEAEAASSEINARLAARTAQEKRDLAARSTKETDVMEARIERESDMEPLHIRLTSSSRSRLRSFAAWSMPDSRE